MKRLSFIVLPLMACGRAGPSEGPGFAISVAPLTLPDVTDACYRVTVTNGPDRTGDLVWQEELCADRFGDGVGALSYVGPCDADVARDNSVTLELLDLMRGATPVAINDDTYQNPCGEIADWGVDRSVLADREDDFGPCTINRLCVENADVRVDFDLTVMRDATQGFVDLAVEFDDIFCSAKLDCRDAFLHDAAGERAATAIVAFACTAGENEVTFMHVSDLTLTCDAPAPLLPLAPMTIPAAGATPGQHGSITPGIYEWAAYQGDEQLVSNGEPLEKCYWNRAIGLDRAALRGRNCTLSGFGTASEAPLTPAMLTAEGVAYPIVRWSVPVLTAGGDLCGAHALGALDSGVQTSYVGADSDLTTIAALTGGATFACGDSVPVDCATQTDVTPLGTIHQEPAASGGIAALDLEYNGEYLRVALGLPLVAGLPSSGAAGVIVLHRPDRASPPDPFDVVAQPGPGELGFEAYRIVVGPERVDVYAGDPRAQRYAVQWLGENLAGLDRRGCPQVFEDAPALRMRAAFYGNYSVDEVDDTLDRVAQARMNVVYWHVRPDVPLPALGIAQGGNCPEDVPGVIENAYPQPISEAAIEAMLLRAAKRHIVVIPSIKLLTHQEKLFASDLQAIDRPCPDRDVNQNASPPQTVEQRVEAEWPGLLLPPPVCPPSKPDCKTRVYNPTYVLPNQASLYDGLVFPILDQLVALFSRVRAIPAVAIGHDEATPDLLGNFAATPLAGGRSAARIFADDLLVIHDHVAAMGLWALMWGDMLLPADLVVQLSPDENQCLVDTVYMDDAVHGDRDDVGVRGPLGALDMIAAAQPSRLRIGDWHYFHPYADYPSNDYLADAGFVVYGASWHRDDYIVPFTEDVVANGGHGMIATHWGLPAAYPPPALNLQHEVAFSGATYWNGGAAMPGQFGYAEGPNTTPGDSRILITRVDCADLSAPGDVTALLAPGDCGHIWVQATDVETQPEDFQMWQVDAKRGPTLSIASNPQFVAAGAPGAPSYTWRLDFALPLDARIGSYRVNVRYFDEGWLQNLTSHLDAFEVGTVTGVNLILNGGFEIDPDWHWQPENPLQTTLYGTMGGIFESLTAASHAGSQALCLTVQASCTTCTYDACGGGGTQCGCPYYHTSQQVALAPGSDRRYLLRYWLRTEDRHDAGPGIWNRSNVKVDVCWPAVAATATVAATDAGCSTHQLVGSITETTVDGWRAIESILAVPDTADQMTVRPYQNNKGTTQSGTTCYDDFELLLIDTP